MPNVEPIPITPLRDDPSQDAIWKRWLRALWQQTNTLTASTVIAVAGGGTGITSYAVGDVLYAATTSSLARLADVATGSAIISGGIATAPVYGKIGLTTHVSGVLPVANAGTNISTYVIGDILYASGTGVVGRLADIATGNALLSGGISTAPSYGKIGLTTHVSGTLAVASGGTGLTATGAAYEIFRTTSSGAANEYTGWPTTRNSTTSSETLTIGSNQAYLTASPLSNLGTISNSGTLLTL